jgi:4'-phosphopantetheinyl transferase
MVQVFHIKIHDYNEVAQPVESLISILPQLIQKKLGEISNQPNRYRSALGEILSRFALLISSGIKPEDAHISYGKNGKPYLTNHPKIHFNVSHSGSFIVCAVADVELGIDVERIRDYNFHIAERYFSKSELADLLALEGDARRDYFFTLWTIKESYLKALGRGLTKSLSSFTVSWNDKGYNLTGESSDGEYSIATSLLPENYQLAVCYKSALKRVIIKAVTLNEILQVLIKQ